jgi:hypothetical protein
MSSSPMASGPLTRARAKEALDYVIGMVFEFAPVDTHPIRNALVILTGKEDDLSIYESWLELSESQINSLQYKVITTTCLHYHKDTWPMSDGSNSCIWSARRTLHGMTQTSLH